jgi:mevalonate kinase
VSTTDRSNYNIAGKTFIVGEYAVLAKKPAILAAIGPRFTLKQENISNLNAIHEASPAGKLLKWVKEKNLPELNLNFTDPHNGKGGFGASSALFALIYRAYSGYQNWSLNWSDVLTFYRDMAATQGMISPSGADLVAQWQGGVSFFDFEKSEYQNLSEPFLKNLGADLLVFSATDQENRKVPTHEHLKYLEERGLFKASSPSWINKLTDVTQTARDAIQSGDAPKLGTCLDLYADILNSQALEATSTHRERLLLRQQKGVLGVKGVGALQSDGLIVLAEQGTDLTSIIQSAQDLNLRLVARGLEFEGGIQ